MRKTELAKFKRIFTEQRNQLLLNVAVIDENLMVRPEDKDEVDQANADIEQNMRMQLKNRETFTLKKIDEALRRIEEGVFGCCESCDEVIGLGRLMARPTTTLCITCKEEEEKSSGAMALGHRLQMVH
jgi:DnaK suppressor protein